MSEYIETFYFIVICNQSLFLVFKSGFNIYEE